MFILPKIAQFTLGTYVVRDAAHMAQHQYHSVCINKTYINNPINISLVETFEKGERPNSNVPDAGLYTIEFIFSRTGRTWNFETEEDRNSEYEKILDTLKNCDETEIPIEEDNDNGKI